MRRFILGWKVCGHEERFQAKIVNYADDFVICCRSPHAEKAMGAMQSLMRKLKLTVNEEKTHLCRLPDESFDFLGYTFGRCYSRAGFRHIGQRPSQKKIRAACRQISEWTALRWCWLDAEEQVDRLNRMMVGWANYFCLGPVSNAYRRITQHARQRLRRWLRRKHKVQGWGYSRFPDAYLHDELGLVQLRLCDRNVPWANARVLDRKPDAGNPHVRFDERGVEPEHGRNLVTLADERASQQGTQTST
jgi:hypothetical protein